MREIKFRAWDKDYSYGRFGTMGSYKMSGYVMRLAPYHPYANKRGYVPEHRLVIENKLGRYLIPRKELVHHLNGKRDDNRIENLKLSNPKDHAKGHIGERNSNGVFVAQDPKFKEKKFRLHDKDRGITQIYTLNELIAKTFRRGKFEYRGEWTGLKDKNGKEIYEGDILKWTHPSFKERKVEYKILEMADIRKSLMLKDDCWQGWIEIIGNIYEHKHLLKENQP